jgi:3-oxoacyl-[acyl-carrier protein] reductase
MRLSGKVAIVTGGGSGFGEGIARKFVAEGAKVLIADRDEGSGRRVAEALGANARHVRADVTRSADVKAMVDAALAAFGGLHILVNNAGVLRDNLLFKMSEADWDTVMNVHLKGAFLCSREVQRHMVAARYGRIVTMSSTSALGNRGQANYATAKAGLQGFTRTLAIELGPFGVTANAIAPGFIETAMTKATAERIGTTIEQLRDSVAAAVPVRRGGLPADIANAAAFFAAEESGYVTGQVLYVDGGRGLL